MRCIDTHCHYNLEPLFSGQPSHFRIKPDDAILSGNWQAHFKTAQLHGVQAGIVVGADLTNSKRAIELHAIEPNLLASVGLHPDLAETNQAAFMIQHPHSTAMELQSHLFAQVDSMIIQLEKLLEAGEVVAVGETGCDYYYFGSDSTLNDIFRSTQARLFQSQLVLSKKYDLPVIVHTRDKGEQAYFDVLTHIEQAELNQPFVLHCVSGPLTYIQQAIAQGAYLGFDGNLTYKNADSLLKILEIAPVDRILIETDAPYLPPTPYRGQICEPWMVTKVAEFVCATKHISEEQLLTNTARFFGTAITTLLSDQTS